MLSTYLVADMVVVQLKGVLTPAEPQLTQSPDGAREENALYFD
jgi:uncharacterized protein YbcI